MYAAAQRDSTRMLRVNQNSEKCDKTQNNSVWCQLPMGLWLQATVVTLHTKRLSAVVKKKQQQKTKTDLSNFKSKSLGKTSCYQIM